MGISRDKRHFIGMSPIVDFELFAERHVSEDDDLFGIRHAISVVCAGRVRYLTWNPFTASTVIG